MALNQIEEEKKKRLRPLPTMDEAFTDKNFSVPKPLKKIQAPMTSGNPNNEAFYGGSNPQNIQKPTIQSTPLAEPKIASLYQPPVRSNLNLPKLKEITNAQRDAELGKMTVAKNGNTTTYDIGGNTLSYEGDKGKISLRNLNQQSDNQQATWNDYRRQLRDRYDAYANSPRGRFFGVNPITTEDLGDDSIGGMFVRGLQSRQARADALIANAEADRDVNRANLLSTLDRNQIAREQLSLDADKNRIGELDVNAENKLRDIQGQVLQNPPIKENPLKPLVIEEPDPNDPTGMTKRQVIKMPTAEGTGYVDDTSGQTTFAIPKPATTEKLLKMRASKDPNFAAAEAEYKMRFGSLPY